MIKASLDRSRIDPIDGSPRDADLSRNLLRGLVGIYLHRYNLSAKSHIDASHCDFGVIGVVCGRCGWDIRIGAILPGFAVYH